MDVNAWLLDADPSIRWQVLRDLLDAPPEEVAAERARVAKEGWGACFLDHEDPDGQWAGGALFPNGEWDRTEPGQPWTATYPVLLVLRQIGVDPADPRVRASIAKVAANTTWENDGQAFFDGEVEPCINGVLVGLGAYFGRDVDGVVARLLDDHLPDGGWNCEAENGATVSSAHSTICVLEGLLLHERATGGTPASIATRERGQEYLLERRLYRRKSTGEPMDPAFGLFSFPTRWHYDVLRALDHFRAVGGTPDPRLAEGVEMVRSKRRPDGTWSLETPTPARRTSRWRTATADRAGGTRCGVDRTHLRHGRNHRAGSSIGTPDARSGPANPVSKSQHRHRRGVTATVTSSLIQPPMTSTPSSVSHSR